MDQEADEYIDILQEQSESHDSQLTPQQMEQNKESISEIMQNQPLIFESEIQQGNFNLLVFYNPETYNELDSTGYSIMHHAISYGRTDVIKYLLKKGANPNQKSLLQQSCLMMACNFGMKDLVKLFIDLGNQINETDERQFTPLIYAVKSKQQLIALYLIALGADINVKDEQQCTLLHWAAYNNDVYMLKYFEGIGNVESIDSQGKSPLIRAINNYSHLSVKYILTRYPQLIPEDSVDLKTFATKQIVEKIKFQQKITKFNLRYLQLIILLFVYVLASVLIIGNFKRLGDQDSFGYGIQLISLFGTLYSAFYTIIFLFKTTLRYGQGTKIVESLGHPKISYNCSGNGNHQHHILEEEHKLDDYQLESNINEPLQQISELLKVIKNHFEDEEYQILDITRTCPTCKILQQKQVYHCDVCNKCVQGFSFHSIYLNQCINHSNHFFYFLLILTSQIAILLNLWATLYTVSQSVPFYRLVFQPFFDNFNLIELLAYLLLFTGLYVFSFSLLLSVFFIIIQVICIFSNKTEHELLYSEQYKYLYEIEKIKTFYFMKLKPIDDIFENVKTYIWNQFTQLRIL